MINAEVMKKKLNWFTDRIGTTIYRNTVKCKCESCVSSGENGVVIIDENHARYLSVMSFELKINYRDEK